MVGEGRGGEGRVGYGIAWECEGRIGYEKGGEDMGGERS